MEMFTTVLNETLMITGFVFVMMLVIEYVNVLTSGAWQDKVSRSPWRQYLFAALLGVTPGCLGAFVVVAMYSHRMLSLGAVVAAMIATSGDESFVMLAMIPKEALFLTAGLFVLGLAAGAITDAAASRIPFLQIRPCGEMAIHVKEACECYPRGRILTQWRAVSPFRAVLSLVLVLFLLAVTTGQVGPMEWNWVRVSILLVSALALFIVSTVPDHFLEEHLWNHVAKKHVPRIFLWTLGTLFVLQLLLAQLQLERIIQENLWSVLSVASLIGLIPESGPHLMFVMLFAKGTIPLSVLAASSIVQDGHGMLPMLAHSRRAFILVKLINLAFGLTVGGVLMLFGL